MSELPVNLMESRMRTDYTPPRPTKRVRVEHPEQQYLNLVRRCITEGSQRVDRTGVGTRSIFGAQMRFSLANNTIPVFTTKRVFWRGVEKELLWMMSGDTNVKTLQEDGVHIWDANATSEFRQTRGLDGLPEGDLGDVYGAQWRCWNDSTTGLVIDQLAETIKMIQEDPSSRRNIISAWNVGSLSAMVLPPCHMVSQWWIDCPEKEPAEQRLSCQVYQRSADLGLGVPFNVASYSLMTHLLAKKCGVQPGELVWTGGDCHVYENHVEPLERQLKRDPKPFPTVAVEWDETESVDPLSIDGIRVTLQNYRCHPGIKMKMAI